MGWSISIAPKDEHIDTPADRLPKVLVSVCNGGETGADCVRGAFRISKPRNFGSARLYFGTQCISLTILDLQYLNISHSATTIARLHYRFAGHVYFYFLFLYLLIIYITLTPVWLAPSIPFSTLLHRYDVHASL